jgi:hypothetical protein
MSLLSNNSKISEVFIQSYKDPVFGMCQRKDFFIIQVSVPVTTPDYIVTGFSEESSRATPYT